MAIHHATLKSAVNKYGPLVAEGKTEEEIKTEIAKDEKGFEPEAIDEIYAAITTPAEDDAANKAKAAAKASKGATKERYTVAQEFRDITDFTWVHNVGDDVSNFDQKRLDELVEGGLVKKESSLKDDE